MADRESFIQKMKALRDEMQATYFKEFEDYITPILLSCPDIGLVHFTTYTPYFNDGEDCEWDVECFSTFMKRTDEVIGEDEVEGIYDSDLPDDFKYLYSLSPSCEGIWCCSADWEAKQLGLGQEVQDRLKEQHERLEAAVLACKEDIEFFIPDDCQWFIANINGEIVMNVKEYKNHG